MKPVTIYALCSSRDRRVRYVGQTCQPLADRLWYHQHRSAKLRTHLGNWIRSVSAEGFTVEAIVLQDGAERNKAEIEWIADLRYLGATLVNGTAGGDGFGVDRTDRHREAISRSLKGRPKSAKHRANLSAANKGKPLPPERAAQLAEARRKPRRNPSKPRASMPPEVRAKIAAANRGRIVSAESRAKMAVSSQARWTPEARAMAAEKTRAAAARKALQ